MPRACPVEYYARRYTADLKQLLDATGLSRGVLRSSLYRRSQTTAWMPRACPVEYYARRYTADLKQPPGCHGLVPWRITLVAPPPLSNHRLDATRLSRGVLRSSLHRRSQTTAWMPRACPVELHVSC